MQQDFFIVSNCKLRLVAVNVSLQSATGVLFFVLAC